MWEIGTLQWLKQISAASFQPSITPGRTKASSIYKATGSLRAVQILLGHTNIENTVRYLDVDVDDALTLSERTDI